MKRHKSEMHYDATSMVRVHVEKCYAYYSGLNSVRIFRYTMRSGS